MSGGRIAIVMLALGALAGSARAEDPKVLARPHVQRADIAYKLGRFAEALTEYTQAYEVFPAPPLLFNIGQCHRNLKEFERARFFFEGYLRENPQAANRALVEELIAESKAELEKQEVAQRQAIELQHRTDEEAANRRAEEDAARQRAAEDRRIADARRQGAAGSSPPLYKRWWFWSVVGGAAIAAGGALYYFSGDTTLVQPAGSLGGLDRR